MSFLDEYFFRRNGPSVRTNPGTSTRGQAHLNNFNVNIAKGVICSIIGGIHLLRRNFLLSLVFEVDVLSFKVSADKCTSAVVSQTSSALSQRKRTGVRLGGGLLVGYRNTVKDYIPGTGLLVGDVGLVRFLDNKISLLVHPQSSHSQTVSTMFIVSQ